MPLFCGSLKGPLNSWCPNSMPARAPCPLPAYSQKPRNHPGYVFFLFLPHIHFIKFCLFSFSKSYKPMYPLQLHPQCVRGPHAFLPCLTGTRPIAPCPGPVDYAGAFPPDVHWCCSLSGRLSSCLSSRTLYPTRSVLTHSLYLCSDSTPENKLSLTS